MEVNFREYSLRLYHEFHDYNTRTHATHDFLMPESIVPMLERARHFIGFLDEDMLASFRAMALEHAARLLRDPEASFAAAHAEWLGANNYASSLCVDNYMGLAGENSRAEFTRRIAPIPGQVEAARASSERDRDAMPCAFRGAAVDRAALLRIHERREKERMRESSLEHDLARAEYCAAIEDQHISAGEAGHMLNSEPGQDRYLVSRYNYNHTHSHT
jgi:hypothetical protein